MSFRMWLESQAPQIGINVNDKSQPFTDMIMDGRKTIETRNSRSLDSVVGKRVGIVRTGVGPAILVGYADVGSPIFYGDAKEFDLDWRRHRVGPESPFYIGQEGKWGYPLSNTERLKKPRPVANRGIVIRKI
jgi:hypothetical protein